MERLLAAAHGAAGYVFAAVALALGLWHFALYLRAMRPKRGTLEWIVSPDRPDFAAGAPDAPLPEADVLLIIVAGMPALLLRLVCIRVLGQPASPGELGFPDLLMYCVIGTYAMSGAVYALARRLGGGRLLATFCALVVSANLSWDSMGAPFAMLALVFLLRSMDDGRPFAASLLAAAAFIAFGAYLCAPVALFAPVLWVILLGYGVGYWIHESNWRRLLCSLLLFPAMLAAAYVLMQLPGAIVSGVDAAGFAPYLALRIRSAVMMMAGAGAQWITPDTLVCMIYGGVCAVLALWAFVKEHDRRAAVAVAVAVGSGLALALGGMQLAPVGSMLAACYIWSRWYRRGGRTQVLLAFGMLLAVCILMDVARFMVVL